VCVLEERCALLYWLADLTHEAVHVQWAYIYMYIYVSEWVHHIYTTLHAATHYNTSCTQNIHNTH
jgi:hypothetical protein